MSITFTPIVETGNSVSAPVKVSGGYACCYIYLNEDLDQEVHFLFSTDGVVWSNTIVYLEPYDYDTNYWERKAVLSVDSSGKVYIVFAAHINDGSPQLMIVMSSDYENWSLEKHVIPSYSIVDTLEPQVLFNSEDTMCIFFEQNTDMSVYSYYYYERTSDEIWSGDKIGEISSDIQNMKFCVYDNAPVVFVSMYNSIPLLIYNNTGNATTPGTWSSKNIGTVAYEYGYYIDGVIDLVGHLHCIITGMNLDPYEFGTYYTISEGIGDSWRDAVKVPSVSYDDRYYTSSLIVSVFGSSSGKINLFTKSQDPDTYAFNIYHQQLNGDNFTDLSLLDSTSGASSVYLMIYAGLYPGHSRHLNQVALGLAIGISGIGGM